MEVAKKCVETHKEKSDDDEEDELYKVPKDINEKRKSLKRVSTQNIPNSRHKNDFITTTTPSKKESGKFSFGLFGGKN